MDIYRREEELNAKVKGLNEEILHLRGKITQQKKHEEMLDKMMKRQHEQIITLENRSKMGEEKGNKSARKSAKNNQVDHSS